MSEYLPCAAYYAKLVISAILDSLDLLVTILVFIDKNSTT